MIFYHLKAFCRLATLHSMNEAKRVCSRNGNNNKIAWGVDQLTAKNNELLK